MAIFSSRQSTHLFEVLVYAGADLTIFQDIFIIRIFKQIGFKIEIKTNLKEVDFPDVTFDLRKETYRPYKKENDCSTSTHLQIIPGPSLSKF